MSQSYICIMIVRKKIAVKLLLLYFFLILKTRDHNYERTELLRKQCGMAGAIGKAGDGNECRNDSFFAMALAFKIMTVNTIKNRNAASDRSIQHNKCQVILLPTIALKKHHCDR